MKRPSHLRRAIIPIFLPFGGCPHRCLFCDQKVLSGASSAIPRKEEIVATIEAHLNTLRGRSPHEIEVAFFGGTFTALPLTLQEELLSWVWPYLESRSIGGIRLSTRPDAINSEGLKLLGRWGVRVIELGAQSLDPEVLSLTGRRHGPQATREASRAIREAGFELGLQLMLGLPGDSPERAFRSCLEAAGLSPSFVRLYPTLVLKGTTLEGLYRRGLYRPWSLGRVVEVSSTLLRLFRERGIGVARLGLHPEAGLGRRIVAGPFHPALRHLAESRLRLEDMRVELMKRGVKSGRLSFLVPPRELSNFIGYRGENLKALKREFPALALSVKPSRELSSNAFRLERDCLP